jgi:hypothetical protein
MKASAVAICAIAVALCTAFAEDSPYTSGFKAGEQMGRDHASYGANMPTEGGLRAIAQAQADVHGVPSSDDWKTGFVAGFKSGFDEATRTNRPATANAEKYDQRSYWAGYKAGYESSRLLGEARIRMHQRTVDDIAKNHYDQDSFDEGFIAGTADADKGLPPQHPPKAKKQ